jgi:hypothetical protein
MAYFKSKLKTINSFKIPVTRIYDCAITSCQVLLGNGLVTTSGLANTYLSVENWFVTDTCLENRNCFRKLPAFYIPHRYAKKQLFFGCFHMKRKNNPSEKFTII